MDGGFRKGAGARGRLTLEAIERQLGLSRRARAEGASNIPASDAAGLSQTEQAIAALIEDGLSRIAEARAQAGAEVERRLTASWPSLDDCAAPAQDARLALKQIEGRVAHGWAQARSAAADARADLTAFKEANSLRRQAIYPDSPVLQAGLLLVAAAFESLFSASLFAETDERGLLGGAVTAVGLSGANVCLGFLCGYIGLRYVQHVRAAMKIAGGLGFCAFGTLALMLNLFAADWRDKLSTGAEASDAGYDADFHLWSLLALESPQAVILLMLGAGVWVFAALKGYSGFDDPYPDFGKLDRAAREAGEALAEERAQAREDLEEPVNTARAEITAKLADLRAQIALMTKTFDEAALRLGGLDAEHARLGALKVEAIELYRRENSAARTTPPPAYFAHPVGGPGPAPDVLAAAAARLDEAHARAQDAQARASAALEGLGAALEDASRRLDEAVPT